MICPELEFKAVGCQLAIDDHDAGGVDEDVYSWDDVGDGFGGRADGGE